MDANHSHLPQHLPRHGSDRAAGADPESLHLHQRFRELTKAVVDSYRQIGFGSWLVEAFDSPERFRHYYSDVRVRQEIVNRLEEWATASEELRTELTRLCSEPLTYQETEQLRYEFPNLQESRELRGQEDVPPIEQQDDTASAAEEDLWRPTEPTF